MTTVWELRVTTINPECIRDNDPAATIEDCLMPGRIYASVEDALVALRDDVQQEEDGVNDGADEEERVSGSARDAQSQISLWNKDGRKGSLNVEVEDLYMAWSLHPITVR